MLVVAVIAFREFLEAFLLIGIFLGINKKFQLKRQKEILLASGIGIGMSLLLPCIVFLSSQRVAHVFSEKNIDGLEGYLLTFSGIFLAYVVFSLHQLMKYPTKKIISQSSKKMEQRIFDISLFLTIIFLIAREGFEVALLAATPSLFSIFWINIVGLVLGFLSAASIGILAAIGYSAIPIKHIFYYTQFVILFIGSVMIKNGITLFAATYFHLHIESILTIPLMFLPNKTTFLGQLLNTFFGLEQKVSMIQIIVMSMYILTVGYLFLYEKKATTHSG